MKAEFTTIVQQLIAVQGRDALFNTTKCKAFLAGTQGQNINERRLLQQAVESGVTSGIANASNIAAYKPQAVQKLQADYYLAPNVANGVVDVLIGIIKTVPPAPVQSPVVAAQTLSQPPVQQQSPPIVQPVYQQVNIAMPQVQNQTNAKLRHGFASFWLWLCYIGSIIVSIISIGIFIFWDDLALLYSLSDLVTKNQMLVSCICSVANLVCFRKILDWKKWGFWGLIPIQIVSLLFFGGGLGTVFSTILYIGIIWAILHFRNAYNAKTAWEQMV
jgi:hypothetical protein